MKRILFLYIVGSLALGGCATRQISKTRPIEVSSELLKTTTEIKQIGSPSVSNPYLTLKVERRIYEKKIYKTTTRYNKTLSTPGWIGLGGVSVGVASLGTYEYLTGKVVLGRDMIGIAVIPLLSSYLFSKIPFSDSENEETAPSKSEAVAHEPVSLKIQEISFSQEIETDRDGSISLNLNRLITTKTKDKSWTIDARLKKDLSVSKKVYISSDFVAQLFRNLRLNLITNKEINESLQKAAKKMEERFQKAKITLITKNIDSSLKRKIESQINSMKRSLGEGFSWDIFPCILTIESIPKGRRPDIKLTVDYAKIENYMHKKESQGIRCISFETPNKLSECLIPCCKIVARHLGIEYKFTDAEPWKFVSRGVEYKKKNGDKVHLEGHLPLIFGKIGGQRISVECKWQPRKGIFEYKRYIVLPSTKQANLVWRFFSK